MKKPAGTERGQVLIAFVVTATFLLAMIGLAVDIGMAYLVKVKLGAAVDAAALAAGKVAPLGEETARAEAARFLETNYPDGLLGARLVAPSTVVTENDQSWNVTVSATALVPAYFAKAVGRREFTVGATATTTLSPVDLVLVLQTSDTMREPGDEVMEELKAAAAGFLENFNPESDRIGLIRFASGVEEPDEFRIRQRRGFDRRGMLDYLAGAEVRASGYAATEEALRCAKAQLDSVPKARQSKRRIIVLFADSAPNGMVARFETQAGEFAAAVSSQSRPTPERPQADLRWLYRKDAVDAAVENPDRVRSLETLPETDWKGTVPVGSFNNQRQLIPLAGTLAEQKCNVDRAARNMAENVANAARSETGGEGYPITINTIGRGSTLDGTEMACPDYGGAENGANIMRRLANARGADTFNPNQPSGQYVSAEPKEFAAAFRKVASNALRLSR